MNKKSRILYLSFTIAGLVHTLWVYISWIFADDYTSSAPAEVAFFIMMPYLLVCVLLLIIMVLYKNITNKQSEGQFKKINLCFAIPTITVITAGLINTLYFFIDFIFNLGTQSIVEPNFYMFIIVPYLLIDIVLLSVWFALICKKLKQKAE